MGCFLSCSARAKQAGCKTLRFLHRTSQTPRGALPVGRSCPVVKVNLGIALVTSVCILHHFRSVRVIVPWVDRRGGHSFANASNF